MSLAGAESVTIMGSIGILRDRGVRENAREEGLEWRDVDNDNGNSGLDPGPCDVKYHVDVTSETSEKDDTDNGNGNDDYIKLASLAEIVEPFSPYSN